MKSIVKRLTMQALPGLEPGFWEYDIRIPSDNHYTIAPLEVEASQIYILGLSTHIGE